MCIVACLSEANLCTGIGKLTTRCKRHFDFRLQLSCGSSRTRNSNLFCGFFAVLLRHPRHGFGHFLMALERIVGYLKIGVKMGQLWVPVTIFVTISFDFGASAWVCASVGVFVCLIIDRIYISIWTSFVGLCNFSSVLEVLVAVSEVWSFASPHELKSWGWVFKDIEKSNLRKENKLVQLECHSLSVGTVVSFVLRSCRVRFSFGGWGSWDHDGVSVLGSSNYWSFSVQLLKLKFYEYSILEYFLSCFSVPTVLTPSIHTLCGLV